MLKLGIVIISCFLISCTDQEVFDCITAWGENLGALTASEVFDYEERGCCQYQGGVRAYDYCSGKVVCNNESKVSCK